MTIDVISPNEGWELFSSGNPGSLARAGNGIAVEAKVSDTAAVGQVAISDPDQCSIALFEYSVSVFPEVATFKAWVTSSMAATLEVYAYDWGAGDPDASDWRDPAWLSAATLLASYALDGLESDEEVTLTSTAALATYLAGVGIGGTARFVFAIDNHRLDVDAPFDLFDVVQVEVLTAGKGDGPTLTIDDTPAYTTVERPVPAGSARETTRRPPAGSARLIP